MAKAIDLTKPLDADEVKYLIDRDRWQDLRTYCHNMELDEPLLPDARRIRGQEPRVGVNATELPDAYKALAEVGEKQAKEAAEVRPEQPPSAPSGQMRGPNEPPTPAPSQPTAEKTDWSKLTVPQLKDELDKRRAEAEAEEDPDQEAIDNLRYSNEDRKDTLVAKLEADDEAIARAEAEGS